MQPDQDYLHKTPRRRTVIGAALGAVSVLCLALSLYLFSEAPAEQETVAPDHPPVATAPADNDNIPDEPQAQPNSSSPSANAENESNTAAEEPLAEAGQHTVSPSSSSERDGSEASASNASEKPARQVDSNEGNSPNASAQAPESPATVTLSIRVTVDSSAAQELGYPATMASGTWALSEGATAYEALQATGLSLGGSASYVSSIDGLAEKMMGASSGWTYTVNGTMPMTAANNYELSNNDEVRWIYVV